MIRFIEKLRTTLKSPDGAVYETVFGRFTLIVGPSGWKGHKSARLQSLTLALAGFADEVQGRREPTRDERILSSLGPLRGAPGDELFCVALDNQGTEAGRYSIHVVEDGSIPDADHAVSEPWDHAAVFPYVLVRDALFGSEDVRQAAFASWTAIGASEDDVVKNLQKEWIARFQDIAAKRRTGCRNVLEVVRSVIEYAGSQKKEAEADARSYEKQAADAKKKAGNLGTRPTEGQLSEAREAVKLAERILETALRTEGTAGIVEEKTTPAVSIEEIPDPYETPVSTFLHTTPEATGYEGIREITARGTAPQGIWNIRTIPVPVPVQAPVSPPPPVHTHQSDQAIVDAYNSYDAIKQQLDEAEAAVVAWEEHIKGLPEVPEVSMMLRWLDPVLERLAGMGEFMCPCCGGAIPDDGLFASRDAKLFWYNRMESLRRMQQEDAARREAIIASRTEAESARNAWWDTAADLRADLAELPDYETMVAAWNRLYDPNPPKGY